MSKYCPVCGFPLDRYKMCVVCGFKFRFNNDKKN